jgi:GC-rich sequence DNA-binding factor
MFKQRKKAKKAGRKRKNDDSDDEDTGSAVSKAREQLAKRKKEKSKTPKEKMLLSFDDDAEEEFRVNKSKANRAVSKALKRKLKTKEPPKTTKVQPQSSAGMYSAESLAQLRNSQSSLSATKRQEFLEAGAEAQKVLTQEADIVEAAVRDDMQGADPPDDDANCANEDQISQAKAIRERKRKIAAGEFVPDFAPGRGSDPSEDFIPLSKSGRGNGGADPAAAMLRKVLGGQMAMKGQSANVKQQEDELREWEDEQIRRGGRGTAAADPGAASALARKRGVSGPLWPAASGSAGGAIDYSSVKPKSLNEIQQQLQDSCRSMEDQLDLLKRREQRLESDINNAETALQKLAKESGGASAQFEYFQGVRDHVSDLCFCLREKEPMLGQLRSTVATIRAHRASSRRQRRAQDLEDELDELVSGLEV